MATRLVLTRGQSAALICRLCFTERRHHELVFIGSQLQQWIEELTSVKIVHAPDAPASVCTDCRTTLEGYESFRQMCHANDEIFQETFFRSEGGHPKKRKIAAKNESGGGAGYNVTTKTVRPVTMEVELGVEPCECSTSDELAVEIKVEEPTVGSEADPLNVKVVTEHDLSRDVVIEILNSSAACQQLVRQKLVHGTSVTNKEKNLICRTLCMQLFFPMVVQGVSISVEAKQKLAECIIEAYDCLETHGSSLPPESEWFWKHSGQSKGEHSGKIQYWVRNAQSKAPESVRRKRRGAQPNLTDEEANAIEELCLYDEQADYRKVSQLMVTTFAYRQNLRGPKSGPSQLCAEFPHLQWFGTLMIEEEFDRMYPNRSAAGTLSSISSLCLMLNHPYNEIACDTIQALLKVMAELTLQGNVRKETASGLPPLEEYASVFVRWQQPDTDLDYFVENVPGDPPYIVCSTMAFAEGQYHLIIMNTAIDCGYAFERAFDVLLKSYKVFNFPVPGRAKKTMEFFDLVYGIQKYSRLSNVNRLYEKIRQAASRLPN